MRINHLFIFLFFSCALTICKAQENNPLFNLPDSSSKSLPSSDNSFFIKYEDLANRSILWSKVIWEKIDLKEDKNKNLYYPTDTIRTSKKSLYYTLLKAIKTDSIKAYADSFFEERRNLEDLLPAIQKRDTTAAGYDILNQGKELSEAYIYQRDISAFDIREYRIKGVWYFDKRRSELRYRILGIAPVAPDVNFIDEIDSENNEEYFVELFWVWYEDARPLLAATPSFNDLNANFPLSFDRILTSRMFEARIYQTENELDDIEALNEEFVFPDFDLMPDEIKIDTIQRENILKRLPFFKREKETTDTIVKEKKSIKQTLMGLFRKKKLEPISRDSTKQQ
jgi:gliding motility associated protien GldN